MNGDANVNNWRHSATPPPPPPPPTLAALQTQLCSVRRLDPDGSCESEHINVFDGNSTQRALLGRVCSESDYVPVFESSSNTLTVQIVTDSARVPRTVFVFYYDVSAGARKFSFTQRGPRLPPALWAGRRDLPSESGPSETSVRSPGPPRTF